jgi:hypothetical protein
MITSATLMLFKLSSWSTALRFLAGSAISSSPRKDLSSGFQGLFTGLKRSQREADYLSPPCVEVNSAYSSLPSRFYTPSWYRTIQKPLCTCKNTDIFLMVTLIARYLRASLTVTNTHVGSQPAEVRGERGSDNANGVLLSPCPFHLPFPLLLWRSPGSQIFCVQYNLLFQHSTASWKDAVAKVMQSRDIHKSLAPPRACARRGTFESACITVTLPSFLILYYLELNRGQIYIYGALQRWDLRMAVSVNWLKI